MPERLALLAPEKYQAGSAERCPGGWCGSAGLACLGRVSLAAAGREGGRYGRGRGGGDFLNLGGGPSGFLGRATSLFDCHTIGLLSAITCFMADPNALGHDHHSKRDILVFLGESKHIFRIVCPWNQLWGPQPARCRSKFCF